MAIRAIATRSLQSLLTLLLLLPVVLLVLPYLPQTAHHWGGTLLLALAVMSVLAVLLSRLTHQFHTLVPLAVLLLVSGLGPALFSWHPWPLYALFLFIASFIGVQTQRRHYPFLAPALYWVGALLYLAVFVTALYLTPLRAITPVLEWGAAVSVIAALLGLNRQAIEDTTATRDDAPPPTRALIRHNQLYTALIVLIVFALSALTAIWRLFTALVRFVLREVAQFFLWILHAPTQQPTSPTHPPNPHPVSRLPVVHMERTGLGTTLLRDVLLLLFALAIVYALYRLFRHVPSLWRYLLSLLATRESQSHGYLDQIETLTRAERLPPLQALRGIVRRRQRVKEEAWQDLRTSGEKVRWLYRQMLRIGAVHGYTVRTHLTPSELARDIAPWLRQRPEETHLHASEITARLDQTLREQALDLSKAYSAVRYGAKEWPTEEVNALYNAFSQDHGRPLN